ncbi:HypC/HybG/HupF family hydrogenase formation chaperone [Saccharolobus caldissimus]|jgi:hydrogenase expression/formation protein HypC|uniref:Hydrogenase n=1 Tax=Saccharolobus caldissimus TaxID=1702097 RepID=A0AAQ4CSK9_9CREN|nr:HypC/HybG/HupF family hydrogenase formation chaperone [Saccharolobus caldissimus]BDB98790.1 hydrogenase [Saccharolobus caldissimus]
MTEFDPYDYAIVGKIVEIINKEEAIVDFNGIKRRVKISLVDAKLNDYVLVHAGYAIKVIDPSQVERELMELLYKLKDL